MAADDGKKELLRHWAGSARLVPHVGRGVGLEHVAHGGLDDGRRTAHKAGDGVERHAVAPVPRKPAARLPGGLGGMLRRWPGAAGFDGVLDVEHQTPPRGSGDGCAV